MFTEKKIIEPEVTRWDTGEVLLPEKEITIKTREDVPFRSITDLKGYVGHETPCHASVCDSSTYTPISQLVKMIFRSPDAFSQAVRVDDGDYDTDFEVAIISDPIEQMDELQDLADMQEAQIATQAANAVSEQSAAGATTTSEEGAIGEAASDVIAD